MTSTLPALEEDTQAMNPVETACGRIPPLWPLQSFVAVNPFLGLSEMPFPQAARLMDRVGHGSMLMDSAYYRGKLRDGSITASDVAAALRETGAEAMPADPAAWLQGQLQLEDRVQQLQTVAGWMDRHQGTAWETFVVDEISKWCSSYWDRAQSAWRMPWRDLPLYEAWKRAAELDANPEICGLRGFRAFVAQLPDDATAATRQMREALGVPQALETDFLHRELMSVSGWSSYSAYLDRQGGSERVLPQLLAIRLAYDAALARQTPEWKCQASHAARVSGFTQAKYVAQLAAEHAFRSRLAQDLLRGTARAERRARPALQAVFCIDVRSEVYRRALEAQAPGIETIGFAGFFGMALEFASTARCPVLLAPGYRVEAAATPQTTVKGWAARAATAWNSLRTSAAACFPAVEVGGILSGFQILGRLLPGEETAATPTLGWHIPLEERVKLAAGALKNMSLDPLQLAPTVLICGHGSQTANNPYGSSLDCGACGGHKGDVNARFAAALLNDPEVRAVLAGRGVAIPSDTMFLAGLHNTTTDDVELFDRQGLPAQLETWLAEAGRQARRERNSGEGGTGAELDRTVRKRALDWSEVRPEWGLAGNAAFVAAPRSRTRELNLQGRVFLHDYDWSMDTDNAVLNLILTAPVVVASWINLQYYGSTVNNGLFGSGNKVLHNVVGTFGVWEGNAGDLRTGLPLQSLHDGTGWRHEPLRLQVFVEAPRRRIDAVLEANPGVAALVENSWIQLTALDGDDAWQCRRAGEWTLTE